MRIAATCADLHWLMGTLYSQLGRACPYIPKDCRALQAAACVVGALQTYTLLLLPPCMYIMKPDVST